MLERALHIDETAYGKEHPAIAADLQALALVLRDLGQQDLARAMFGRALALVEGVLGPNHPHTAEIRLNLSQLDTAS